MNKNKIETDDFSNPRSREFYEKKGIEGLDQCGGCSFFAEFNLDWGLCCNPKSRHHLETVYEHFTCQAYVHEGWGPHSFTEDGSFHCKCQGQSVFEMMGTIITLLDRDDLDNEFRSHLRALRRYAEEHKQANKTAAGDA